MHYITRSTPPGLSASMQSFYAALFGVALAGGILAVPHASEFIYFRF